MQEVRDPCENHRAKETFQPTSNSIRFPYGTFSYPSRKTQSHSNLGLNKELMQDSHPLDRSKAFTIGDRQIVFDKAQRKPTKGDPNGYDGHVKVG